MANMLFANNAATTLASGITNTATSLTVATGTGALFPSPSGSTYFYMTLANTAGTVEIVKCTARSTDTFTIVRGQDGTLAVAWNSGDKVEQRVVAADLNNFGQLDSANTWAQAQTFSSGLSGALTGNVTGNVSGTAASITGVNAIAQGGTNNGSLAVTAGGTLYTDGTKVVNVGAGTTGQYLKSNGASAPTWSTLAVTGTLLNIQYFTSTATYTPTSGTNFVIVEVVGGGGGSSKSSTDTGGTGGTSSFGALVSATGGGIYATPGAGASGDLNLTGGQGNKIVGSTTTVQLNNLGGVAGLCYGTYGFGANLNALSTISLSVTAGAGGGASRKKITSAFSGVTVTVGAAGTAGTNGNAGNAGIVIVYEYA